MPLPEATRRDVRELDGDSCAYCRSPAALSVATYEVDHIVPVSAGGRASLDNLAWTCPACNRSKGSRQTARDTETQQIVPLHHPRQDDWATNFGWSDAGSIILGLTPTGRATVAQLRLNRPDLVRLRLVWQRIGYRLDGQ